MPGRSGARSSTWRNSSRRVLPRPDRASARSDARPDARKPRELYTARPAPTRVTMTLPAWVAPQLATLVSAPPAGHDWVHEIKLDGYRLLLRIDRGRARLLTRNRLD